MKKLIGIVLLLLTVGLFSNAQTVGHLRYDTVKMYKQGGTAEMVLINKTKDTIGFLFNVGGGRTEFRRVKQLNDSTLIFGIDTFSIRTIGGGGGGGTDDAEIPIKIENDSIKLQYNTNYLGVKDNRLVSKITTFFSYPTMRLIPTNQLDSSYVYIYRSGPVYIPYRYNPLDVSTADDSVSTIVTATGARLQVIGTQVWLSWFGPRPGDGIDDRVGTQKAFNFLTASAAKNPMNVRYLKIEPGLFNFSKGLLLMKDDNLDGNPEFFNATIEGAKSPFAGSGFGETHFDFTDKTAFGIGIQKGKGVEISNLYITGTNQLNYTLEQVWNGTSTFVSTTERTNAQSPQAGFVIDPFGSSTTGTDRYPGWESYYAGIVGNGGSTGFKIHDLKIAGFYVNIIHSPNNNTQNNELHDYNKIWLDNCRYGFVTTNSQERLITARSFVSWNSVHTLFETRLFGANRGEPPVIDGVNIAGGVYQIFNFSGAGGYYPVIFIRNVYAELVYRIGTVEGIAVKLVGCHIGLGDPTQNGVNVRFPNTVFDTDWAEFDDCIISYYNGAIRAPINMSGRIRIVNSQIGQQIGIPNNTFSREPTEIDYDNVNFYTSNGWIDNKNSIYAGDGIKNVEPLKPMLKYNQVVTSFSYTAGVFGTPYNQATQERRATGTLYKRAFLGDGISLTVVGDSATATIASLNGKTYLEGSIIWGRYSLYGHMMRIRRITGTTVVFDHLTSEVVTGTVNGLAVETLQYYSPPILADINSGTLTNVFKEYQTTAYTATAGLYWIDDIAAFISAPGAGTGTIEGAQNNGTRGIISSFTYDESGFSYTNPLTNAQFPDGTLFTKGAIYKNTSIIGTAGIFGWEVTKSGIKGTTSPPEFRVHGMFQFNNGLISDGTTAGMGGTFISDIGITSSGGTFDWELFAMDSVGFDANYIGLNALNIKKSFTSGNPAEIWTVAGADRYREDLNTSTGIFKYTYGVGGGYRPEWYVDAVKAMEFSITGQVGIGTLGTVGIQLRIDGTDAIRIPGGTTAQRPASPLVGYGRYATDSSGTWEIFNGTTWEALATRNFARTFGGGGASDGNGIYTGPGTLTTNAIVTLSGSDITWLINSTGRFKFNGLKSASGPVTVLVLQADSAVAQAEIEVTYLQTVTTSDATPVTAFTIIPPAGSEETITVHVVMNAKRIGVAGAAYAYEERTYEWNGSATLTAFAANTDNDVPEKYTSGLSTCGFTITNSGTNIIVQFTGQAAVNIQATFAIAITRTTIPL